MRKLAVFEAIDNQNRISSVDIFRSIAIIAVVGFHFNRQIPKGFLGVDLFFVISGLLVGGLLTTEFEKGHPINFFRFFLQRGFKIWPSYYSFILFGSILAIFLYGSTNPDQVIPAWDLKRYLFFYQNYTGAPFHWSFDHLWSLCVEEHFYVLLPLLFIFIQQFVSPENRKKTLLFFVILMIIVGIASKHISYFYTNSKDTYCGTHNRIDAFAWGILLNLIIVHYGQRIKSLSVVAFIAGSLIFIASVYFSMTNLLFNKVYFLSVIPFSFFLLLLALYYVDFSKLKFLRFIAYYSYNWYLWHPIFVIFLRKNVGETIGGFCTYLIISFLFAFGATILIEEPILRKRGYVLAKLFKRNKAAI